MYDGQDQSLGVDFSSMTFGQKISLAMSLSKQKGLTVFAAIFFGYLSLVILSFVLLLIFGFSPLALFSAASGGTADAGAVAGMIGSIFGILVVLIVIIFLFQFFMIGLNSLVLRYIDGEEPSSVIEVLFSPWKRFGSIVIVVVLWLIIDFGCGFVLGLIALIPILGWLVYFVGTIILSMAMFCAMFYIADNHQINPVDSVMQPFRMVTGRFWSWLGSMLFLMVAIFIPIFILSFIGALIGGGSTGGLIFTMFLILVYVAVCSIFGFFFMALTYKQSKAPTKMVTDVFN